jgi:hypothetical protein
MNQLRKINKSSAADIGLNFVLQMVQDLGPPDLSVPDVRLPFSAPRVSFVISDQLRFFSLV